MSGSICNFTETISRLSESSDEIGNVIKMITSIAQQTNLLALNATIEAARAGEAGKGFAVVANEVKELARQTAEATEEIGAKIENLQGDSQASVAAIAQISEVIGQVSELSRSIAAAVEQQSTTTAEIVRNLGEASTGVAEISSTVAGVAKVADGTSSGAEDARNSAAELARMAEELKAVVAQYTLS